MSTCNLLGYRIYLILGQARTTGISHSGLEVSRGVDRVLAVVVFRAEVIDVRVIKDIPVRDAVARTNTIKRSTAARHDRDGFLDKHPVLEPTQIAGLAQGVDRFDNCVKGSSVARLKVDQQNHALCGLRLVHGPAVMVDDGLQGVDVLEAQGSSYRRENVSDRHVAVHEPDVGLDTHTPGAQGSEERDIVIVVVVAVACDRKNAIERVQRPGVQGRSGSLVDALGSQDIVVQKLVDGVLLRRDCICKRVV